MHADLAKAWELLDADDPQGAVRELRRVVDGLTAGEVAPVTRRLAEAVGIEDLAGAAAALASRPADAGALYAYGYACIEHGLSEFAVPALREALAAGAAPVKRKLFGRGGAAQAAPRQVLLELAVALEDGERHAEAVAVLQEHRAIGGDWPDGYLLAHNALMDGRVELAREVFEGLAAPDGDTWQPAADRIRRSLARAAAVPPAGPQDLRGWHYTLTGGLLATLSPHGYEQGMTGRWAYLGDSWDNCRRGLERLRTVLEAAGRRPSSVALLPDRGSEALGLAAAALLGIPAAPYRPGGGVADALVVAYDLNECDQELVGALYERAPGEVLYEHATCWTDPPAVSADVSGLLVQHVVAPWEPNLRVGEDGEVERGRPTTARRRSSRSGSAPRPPSRTRATGGPRRTRTRRWPPSPPGPPRPGRPAAGTGSARRARCAAPGSPDGAPPDTPPPAGRTARRAAAGRCRGCHLPGWDLLQAGATKATRATAKATWSRCLIQSMPEVWRTPIQPATRLPIRAPAAPSSMVSHQGMACGPRRISLASTPSTKPISRIQRSWNIESQPFR
ncbi:hypothetical protein [Kitasatospora cheerisanensis]|uniref:hypothetical protein n=1 Tax=Kitasatospora cheerisanensis TaxID=81942 RepID=UPI000A8B6438